MTDVSNGHGYIVTTLGDGDLRYLRRKPLRDERRQDRHRPPCSALENRFQLALLLSRRRFVEVQPRRGIAVKECGSRKVVGENQRAPGELHVVRGSVADAKG